MQLLSCSCLLFLIAGTVSAGPMAHRLQRAERYLLAEDWKAASRSIDRLEVDLVSSDRNRVIPAEHVARLAALKAISRAGRSDERTARWYWHIAMNLDPAGELPDLDRFPTPVHDTLRGELPRLLTGALDMARLGPAGRPMPNAGQLGAWSGEPKKRRQPPTDEDRLTDQAILSGLTGRVTFYADIDEGGYLTRPVVREIDGPPLLAYVVLNLYAALRIDESSRPRSGSTIGIAYSLDRGTR